MTAPSFRAVSHKGEVADYPPSMLPSFVEIDTLHAEITSLQAQLKDEQDGSRVEIDNLTDLLKASGTHVANLATALAMYQVERDEAREQCEEYRDRFDLACEERDEALARVDEVTVERDAARAERDAARSERDTWRAGVKAVSYR